MATKTDDLPPFIIDLDDLEEPINILCHGDTGAGKNRLWGPLLTNGRGVILVIEEGAVSMKMAGLKGVKAIRCRSWPDIVKAYEWLRDNIGTFEWVMIDSITKAQSLCIRHIMEMVVKANSKRDPHVPAQGDYFKWQLSIKQLVEDFNALDTHTIWLARSMVKENPDGDEITVPSIEGKDYGISAWVCGEMSLVCYLKKVKKPKSDKVVRQLFTNEHTSYWCKDWYDVLPHVIEFGSEKGVAEKIIGLIQESGASAAGNKERAAANRKPVARKKATATRRGTK